MTKTEVARIQFRLVDNEVTHTPTGAWWRARQGSAELSAIFMGGLGAPMNNGCEYDIKRVEECALAILRERSSVRKLA